jgi:hypothetical protein
MIMIYKGTRGKPVKTLEHLQELAENRKSIIINHWVKSSVLPAKSILYRQCADVISLLKSDRLFEYIKPTPHPKQKTTRLYGRKKGKKEDPRIELSQQDIKDMLQLLNDIPNSSPGHNDYRFKNTYAICSFLRGKLRELEG